MDGYKLEMCDIKALTDTNTNAKYLADTETVTTDTGTFSKFAEIIY